MELLRRRGLLLRSLQARLEVWTRRWAYCKEGLFWSAMCPRRTAHLISQGSLQIINRHGKLIKVLNDNVFLDTPWDLTINDNGNQAQVFVSNVKSGTVSRLDLAV